MTADLGLYTLTIAAVSMTPGMCMTLAFTLGMTVGYRAALWTVRDGERCGARGCGEEYLSAGTV